MAGFSAKPRSRPLFGRERVWPFTARVQAAEGEVRNLNGEVAGKALIPSWVLPAVLVAILAIACIVILFTALGGSPEEGAPTEAPAATATPVEETPAPTEPPPEPTQPPPEPTQPPPEPTQSPPEPTEPTQEPPTEPPPEQPTEPPPEPPTEPPPGEGGLPCAPLAAGLVLAPLLVVGKKGRGGRNA